MEACHSPLAFLNVSACQLVSQAASAAARMQPRQLDVSLLRLSVLALLHNLTWVEQTVGILRRQSPGVLGTTASSSLREYVVGNEKQDDNGTKNLSLPMLLMTILQSNIVHANKGQQVIVPVDDLEHAVNMVCSRPPVDETSVTADSLLTAFFTGQDLLLAAHFDLCLLLYQRYQSWFHKLKQPKDENRARIDVFLASRGSANPFANLVL
jgi:hypothetical protein